MKIRPALRYTLTVLALVPFTLAPIGAEAKPKASKGASEASAAKKKSLALAPLEGKKNNEVRGWIRDALKSGFYVTDAEDFKVKPNAEAYAKMGSDLGVDAVAVGKVEKSKLTVTIYQASDGRVLIALQFKAPPGPKLKSIIDKRLVEKLYGAFGMESPDEAARKRAEAKQLAEEEAGEDEGADEDEEEKPKAKEADSEESESESGSDEGEGSDGSEEETPADSGPHGPILKPLDIRAGVRFSKRTFAFRDTLSQLYPDRGVRNPLRDYNGGLDLAVFARLELYPAGLFGADGFASNLGLVGSFSYGIPSTTVYRPADGSAPKNLTSQVHEWNLGARVRVPFSTKAGLGITAAYGQQRYFLKGDETGSLVPDIQYGYLRLGPDLWVDLGKITVEAFVGGRIVLGTGELEEPRLWFRNVGARGFDAGLNLSYAVSPSIAVLAGVDFTRYGFNFNPIQSGDLYVAGGATDQYVGGWLGASFRLPGKAAGE